MLSVVACSGVPDTNLFLVPHYSQPVAGKSWSSILLVVRGVVDGVLGGLGGLEEDVVVEDGLVDVLASPGRR